MRFSEAPSSASSVARFSPAISDEVQSKGSEGFFYEQQR